ncbi:MAG: hypothetical protein ABIW84_01560 [Ilumatobacteraceae bacterium]
MVPITGGVTIQGYGDILLADILNAYCECPAACIPQVTTVTITVPVTCECPYEFPLLIKSLPCLFSYEVQQTFGSDKYYGYQDPSGSTLTAAQYATAVAASINADPTAVVTAVAVGAVLTLTEKDCDATCGFQAFSSDAVIATTTPHTNSILSANQLAKLFPIQWGHPGSRPNLTFCGTYCVYHFVLRKSCDVQDISQANSYNCYEQEVYFYVNNSDCTAYNLWCTEMQTAFTAYLTGCLCPVCP